MLKLFKNETRKLMRVFFHPVMKVKVAFRPPDYFDSNSYVNNSDNLY